MPQSRSAQARNPEPGPILFIRRASERGHADHGWLKSFHTFSFAHYSDPKFMGFRALRVINEDRVVPNAGFPTHGHRDMEILSFVLEGALAHEDSLGKSSIIRPGELQRMSAGTGVHHSEYNASESESLHFLQIWIIPESGGIEPGYEQKAFPMEERTGNLRLIASRDGRAGSVRLHQDVSLYNAVLKAGQVIEDRLPEGRYGWLQVARGVVNFDGEVLAAGDGVALAGGSSLELKAPIEGDDAEVLLFDLA